MNKRNISQILSPLLLITVLLAPLRVSAEEIRPIAFPTEPIVTFHDDFGEQRAGHSHEGIDMLGPKMTPLYSAVDGRVTYLPTSEPSYGYMIVLRDADDYTYHYIHVNNDTPGTDDGQGGVEHAYAPGIYDGARVTKGQLVGWMGDSGNAENVGSHLHFEIRLPDGTPINPYPSLIAAKPVGKSFNPTEEMASSPNINTDKNLLSTGGAPPCASGSLIKSPSFTAVYYCGADGKRYVFTNDKSYFTWYANFNSVVTITDEQLAAVPLGKNVTYRPGVKLIKIQSDPKVYAVAHGGVLRWVTTPEIATALYGTGWVKKVDDVSVIFYTNYTVGEPITSPN